MLTTNTKNIALALCISAALIALAFYNRHAASPVPVDVFYLAGALFFLFRCRARKKQCAA